MQTRMRLVIVLLLAIWTAGAIQAQITSNPIPAPIVKRGLAVLSSGWTTAASTTSMVPGPTEVRTMPLVPNVASRLPSVL